MKAFFGKVKKKLRAENGETLIEILIALVVITLATLMFGSMVSASWKLNSNTREKDRVFYESLSKIEEATATDAPGTVKFKFTSGVSGEETANVKLYKDGNLGKYKAE